METERLGTHAGKDVFLILCTLQGLIQDELGFSSAGFVAVILLGEKAWETRQVYAALRRLYLEKANYLMFHGLKAEKAHDIADQVRIELPIDVETEANVIFTTWHTEESIQPVVWEALHASIPAEDRISAWSAYAFFCLDEQQREDARAELNRLIV
ncbi:MAG: hypothetical protein M3Z35_11980 [Nitrospirota bacterium]|nr:hypothetical protein [Nitrospirota bacterium]